jgi:uncharacterized surface protein with fasciclin (FAS1) repeats
MLVAFTCIALKLDINLNK